VIAGGDEKQGAITRYKTDVTRTKLRVQAAEPPGEGFPFVVWNALSSVTQTLLWYWQTCIHLTDSKRLVQFLSRQGLPSRRSGQVRQERCELVCTELQLSPVSEEEFFEGGQLRRNHVQSWSQVQRSTASNKKKPENSRSAKHRSSHQPPPYPLLFPIPSGLSPAPQETCTLSIQCSSPPDSTTLH